MKSFFQKNWQHFAVLGAFIVLMLVYFSPEFDGYSLKQHDIEQFAGMAKETVDYREVSGEEPLWTNSMFGGMPTIQISTLYSGNIFQTILISYQRSLGSPAAIFLMHLIGFYILALCLRLRPIVGFIGAVAFAFSSYELIILQAGHNSKAMTVAFMAPVIGSFLWAYRQNWKWGALMSAIFMSFELACNHLQVTYYLAFLLFGLGVYEFIMAVKNKNLKRFVIVSSSLIGAYILAVFINYGNITLTNDYAKHTIRGGNDITINPDKTPATKNTAGLDKDYITNWSYGVDESFTLVSPYVKGSASVGIAESNFRELIENSDRPSSEINDILNAPYPVYWGEQPITSGPVYLGVVVIFLMVLGMFYIKDKSKWVFLSVSVLALMLSWGKNFMGLTDFFIESVPGYNKFRTVTIILVLIELCVPVLMVLLLDRLYREREKIKETKKTFLIISATFIVFLIGLKVVGLGDNFTNSQELQRVNELPLQIRNQIAGIDPATLKQNYGVDVTNPSQLQQFIDQQVENSNRQFMLMKSAREDIFNASMNRSILFAFLIVGIIALYFFTSIATPFIFGGIAAIILIDLIPVDQNYLNAETLENGEYKYWVPSPQTQYPLSPEAADLQILEMESSDPKVKAAISAAINRGEARADELDYTGADRSRVVDAYKFSALNLNTNYRVFDINGGWSSTRASYFHKSLGGYHGAKLRNIQNLFDFHISKSNNKVFDILNVKYFIQGQNLNPNPQALGNAWFVRKIEVKNTANDELLALGNEFKLTNVGSGEFLVNGTKTTTAQVYGSEKIQYLIEGKDTMDVPLTNGLREGMEAMWVMDANGITNLVPTSTMENDSLNSFKKLVQIKVVNEFNPKDEAVMLSDFASKLDTKSFTGEGTIQMTSYAPNRITYTSKSNSKQFAVFSEIYYPEGWKAYIDGKEVPILKTDYLLRGLEIEAGTHKIEFKFSLPKYDKSNNYAGIGSVLLLLLLGAIGFMEWKKKKANAGDNL